MLTLKRLPVVVACLSCMLFIAACGSPSNAGAQGYQAPSTSTQATAAPTSTTQSANAIQGQKTDQKSNQAQTSTNQGSQNQAQGTSNTSQGTSNTNKQNTSTTANKNTQSNGQTNASQNTQNNSNNANQATNNQGNMNTLVKVVQANVNGQMVSILTTGTGMTLYYRTSDPMPNSSCTGNCAQTWPPFLAQGTLIPSAGIQSGQLTVQKTVNGNQVEYNGHPLYTYVGDGAPGKVTGQGVGNVWYTVSVTTQAQHW